MLTVRYGPFQPELEAAFISRLKELVAEGVPTSVAVVAPSRRLADRLERLAAVEHGLSLLGVRFHTFHSLATAIVESSGFPDKKLIDDPVFHDRLIDLILEERPGLANFFGGRARPKALAGALRASLRDLIDAGVDAAALEEHFGAELLREPQDRERLTALLSLAQAYQERLDALGVFPPASLVRLAARKAEDSRLLGEFRELLYYGFYDLTGLQLEFFESVVTRFRSTLFFPYRRGHPAFRFAEPFFEQKLGGYKAEPADSAAPSPALGPSLDHLFGPGRAPLAPGRLEVVSASGARDEAWAAAKEALRLADSGRRYEEIGVVARTLEPYRAALTEAFAENAVPFDLGEGAPLLSQPLAKNALNLLRLRQADFPAAAVEDLFSSPYFRPQPEPRRLRHWRQAIRVLGIRAGWLQWRGKLEARAGDDLELSPGRGSDGYRIPKADLAALWDLVSRLERELGAGKAGKWSEAARRALETVQRHLGLSERPDAAEIRTWDALIAALESLSLLDLLESGPEPEEFLDAFEQKLRRATLETAAGARGVRIMDAMDARGQSFQALILIGLNEKLFPRLVVEDPLLREPVRAALRHPAGYWIARKSAGYEEERLLFYLTVASARERVVCVYPRSDESGKAQVPSLYLRELCRAAAAPFGEAQSRVPRQPAERLRHCEAGLLTPKELSLRLAFDGILPEEERARVAALNHFGEAGVFDGLIGEPEEHLKRVRRDGFSPSALDELAQCPFRYFADRVLALGAPDEGAEKGEFAAWVRGKIYHAVLEKFYAGPGGSMERLDDAIESAFSEYDWKRMGVYPVLWLSAKQTMSGHLRGFLAWDLSEQKASGLKPRWLEKELRGDWPGRAPKGFEGLRAHGVIDRVDVDEAGERFRIVDYKTRWRNKGKLSKSIAEGRLHQLPLYAQLAAEALGGKAELAQAAIYALEEPPADRAQSYSGQEWAAGRKAFFELAAKRLEDVARGRFPIEPNDGDFGYCRHCEFSALCRKNHGPSRFRAADGRARRQ